MRLRCCFIIIQGLWHFYQTSRLFIEAVYVHNLGHHCINSVNITKGCTVKWALRLVREAVGINNMTLNEDVKLTHTKMWHKGTSNRNKCIRVFKNHIQMASLLDFFK